jgi:hypothetical protein
MLQQSGGPMHVKPAFAPLCDRKILQNPGLQRRTQALRFLDAIIVRRRSFWALSPLASRLWGNVGFWNLFRDRLTDPSTRHRLSWTMCSNFATDG